MGEAFHKTLIEYDLLDKVGHISTDNASANDTMMHTFCWIVRLEELLFIDGKELNLLSRHIRCMCHIINLCVQELLKGFESQPANTSLIEEETTNKRKTRKRMSTARKKRLFFFSFFY